MLSAGGRDLILRKDSIVTVHDTRDPDWCIAKTINGNEVRINLSVKEVFRILKES